ncbi:MAG: hypothetical protein ACRD11_10835 [Terriglobia bacterium]
MISEEFTRQIKLEKRRMTPQDLKPPLHPWVRAKDYTRCALYWLPVRSIPVPLEQRRWLLAFFKGLCEFCSSGLGLRPEVFLQYKVVQPALYQPLTKNSMELLPILGLSRKPGSTPPPLPTGEDVKAFQDGRKKFNIDDYVGDYCYWFLDNAAARQWDLFFGHGGLTTLFLKAGPAAQLPQVPLPKAMAEHPFFRGINVQSKMASAARLADPFLAKSKELFGAGLENEPHYQGILFVVPLLASKDFFHQPEEETGKYFELFDLYITESSADGGILLASKNDIDDQLAGLVESLREKAFIYPDR